MLQTEHIYNVLKKGNLSEIKELCKLNVIDEYSKKYCSHVVGEGAFGVVMNVKLPTHLNLLVMDIKNKSHKITVPIVGKETKTPPNYIYEEDIKNNKIVVKSDGGDMTAELFINSLTSHLFTNGTTPHTVICMGGTQCFGFSTKTVKNILLEYVGYPEMKELGYIIANDKLVSQWNYITTLHRYLEYLIQNDINLEEIINSIVIQYLHTCYILETKYKLHLTDAHLSNILVKIFDTKPYFQGRNMNNIEYFKYKIPNGKSIYIKNSGFCIKIGDLGIDKCEFNNTVIYANYSAGKQRELLNPVDIYIPTYIPFLKSLQYFISIKYTALIGQILNLPYIRDVSEYTIYNKIYKHGDVVKFPSYSDLLNNSIFDKYRKVPNVSAKAVCEIGESRTPIKTKTKTKAKKLKK
ncbi:MAG: hypothetical protein Faunusvirus7_20 [Faunusvirus sp.]|jgi:hypothetical protein|uniref:Uncharacterized protein n=1 Tax=Faunusvirus sp. TaxID=2487766 RepID=A0A3G4ZWI3_9VIRU|nr:MAG: hypothetical protein Faunusvirus7_20 [Faunusvirus sp.]